VAAPLDTDGDGVPDAIEIAEGMNPEVKDNDIFANANLFVRQQYRDFLQREGDAGGVAFWGNAVQQGTVQRESFVLGMLQSEEISTRVAPIIRLYLAYFRRPPDRDGLRNWAALYASGMTLEQISDQFALSAEFVALYGSKTNGEFIQLVYRNVLERQPDAGGYTYWLARLDDGRITRGGVMAAFSNSAENALKTYNKFLVSMLYVAMMQRSPDPDGFSFWVSKLDTGTSVTALLTTFYYSVEYRDRFINLYSMAATPRAIDAARFLTQASFGARSLREIADLQKKGPGLWIEEQIRIPAATQAEYLNGAMIRHNTTYPFDEDSYEAIWQQWLFGPDQLRGRMSFALSQIFVVSNIAPNLNPWAMSSYMDLLNRNAFGNYRQLLQEVTLHPAMGYYLDMLKSQKEDPVTGRHPNENFAREVLQLFSIGLVQINIDGTPVLDAAGKTIPTFSEDTVRGFAKAFSGWSFGGGNTADPKAFFSVRENWQLPMQAWPSQHSQGEKLLLNGTVLPAFQTPERDLKDALDNIFYHPNVGPFICRELIQRFVTSNPSRGQIQRCATVFNNDGFGERGDLGMVIKTILLDPEARDAALATGPTFGKQREPVIRFANYLRAFNAKSTSGRNAIHYLDSPDDSLGQSPLLAPSVFNFFSPNFRPVGPIGQAGLVAPEFQITTETSVAGTLNFFGTLVDRGAYGYNDTQLTFDYGTLQAIALDPAKLADHINMLLMAGSMSPALKDSIVRAVTAMPTGSTRNRVEAALMIAAASPEFVIQK
jgi:uncharacterized protein (DUF1800 family)